MSDVAIGRDNGSSNNFSDVAFAFAIVAILTILFLPLPSFLIDIGLAISIALSVLILMVALWIRQPLEFSSFPTILLIATMLRLSLNVATTRLILSNGSDGYTAAGYVIGGFSNFLMAGDFVIGVVVFIILVVVNFLVISKGASRIAEVGARFTLDAIPGKQMAIDADLSAGLLTEQEARRRRRELEEESSFYGAMDGASKFVRGDAVAGLVITAINIFGGIIIGVTRNGMSLADAADVFTRLSVGDGLVSQIPALIISLGAGLLVSKGNVNGRTDEVVSGQLGNYPRALLVVAGLMFLFGIMPGLPLVPFVLIACMLSWLAYAIPRNKAQIAAAETHRADAEAQAKLVANKDKLKDTIKPTDIEVRLGRQLSSAFVPAHGELAHRVTKMRRRFAQQFGFVVPDIKLSDDLELEPKTYELRIHGTVVASQQLKLGNVLVVCGDGPLPSVGGEEVCEPAFGIRSFWIPEAFADELRREGFTPIDSVSVLLTHVSEVVRNNLAQLLSYRDMRHLLNNLDAEYHRLLEEICPSHISYSGLQAVLKCLLAERVSIKNLNQILEAIAEIAPHVRRAEQIAEHVRLRLSSQICGDLTVNGTLSVLRLGNRWELAFHESLRRDAKGEIIEFDIDPLQLEQFTKDAENSIKRHMDDGEQFALVVAPDARPYVRMIVERLFPTLPILSHVEIARGIDVRLIGTIS